MKKEDTRKPETIIRELKILLRDSERLAKDNWAEMKRERSAAESWRRRATKAEQECAEWKRRFDLLLSKAEAIRVEPS